MEDPTHSDEGIASVIDTETVSENTEHELLQARDTIVGLQAEVDTLTARLAELENTELGTAFARVDQLAEQREALLHDLRKVLTDFQKQHAQLQELLGTTGQQAAQIEGLRHTEQVLRDQVDSAQRSLSSVRSSSTWKIGSAVIRPLSKIRGRLPR